MIHEPNWNFALIASFQGLWERSFTVWFMNHDPLPKRRWRFWVLGELPHTSWNPQMDTTTNRLISIPILYNLNLYKHDRQIQTHTLRKWESKEKESTRCWRHLLYLARPTGPHFPISLELSRRCWTDVNAYLRFGLHARTFQTQTSVMVCRVSCSPTSSKDSGGRPWWWLWLQH